MVLEIILDWIYHVWGMEASILQIQEVDFFPITQGWLAIRETAHSKVAGMFLSANMCTLTVGEPYG